MKLIASDMDGTLLNKFWRISEQNKEAIMKAQQLGVQFIIATGRPYTNVHVILDAVGISCPVISLNGAQTHSAEGKLLASKPLTKEQARIVSEILTEEGMYFELMTPEGAISLSYDRYLQISHYYGELELPHLNEKERHSIVLSMAEERIRNENCQFVSSFDSYLNNEDSQILKIFALTEDQEVFKRADARVREIAGLAISSSAHGNLEVNAELGNKGYAVAQYAASIGINPSQIMALGDGYNDLTMLQMAGRGVVMENAPESLKALIPLKTKRNTEDGVAHAIYEMLHAYYGVNK